VRQPINELGRQLANQVIRLAGGEDVEPSLVLPTQLIIRGSA
jgi:DNA-binding LacI/PurR family transcriptional regulator